MPMNEYGEIIRNSSPPPPIPRGSDGNNNGNNNGNSGSGIYIILGIVILVIVIISIYNADSNNKNNQTNATDTNDGISEEYGNSPYEEEQSEDEDEDWQYEENNDSNDNESISGFYFPNSDSEYISYDDLQDMSEEEVCLALNEIYARRGRKFSTDWIREYFESQSWYNPIYDPEDFTDSVFNEYERENIDTIVKYQQDKGWR